jgi:hypothetical protein
VDLMFDVDVNGRWLCVCAVLFMLWNGVSTDLPLGLVVIGQIGVVRPIGGEGFYGASRAAVHVVRVWWPCSSRPEATS